MGSGLNVPTPLQMATAAATLANLRLHHEPQAITTVSATGGPALPPDRQPARQVLDAEVAFVVSEMLADEANRALASGPGPSLPGRRAAVWTGASDGRFDDWAIGYTAFPCGSRLDRRLRAGAWSRQGE